MSPGRSTASWSRSTEHSTGKGLAVTADNLRRNDLQLGGEITLAIDLVGLRLETDAFLAQVKAALSVAVLRRAS